MRGEAEIGIPFLYRMRTFNEAPKVKHQEMDQKLFATPTQPAINTRLGYVEPRSSHLRYPIDFIVLD